MLQNGGDEKPTTLSLRLGGRSKKNHDTCGRSWKHLKSPGLTSGSMTRGSIHNLDLFGLMAQLASRAGTHNRDDNARKDPNSSPGHAKPAPSKPSGTGSQDGTKPTCSRCNRRHSGQSCFYHMRILQKLLNGGERSTQIFSPPFSHNETPRSLLPIHHLRT